jgi:ATP-dependent DNA helicase DinG
VTTAVHILGPEGPFASRLPEYEVRAGQLQMAAAVETALASEHVLFCEAGTGTGKTFAYLVPAVLSGKKVVISTATRALQDQLLKHDVPRVEAALGRSISVVGLKGLSNYICKRRLADFRASPAATERRWARSLSVIDGRGATTGDIAEFDQLSEDDPIFGHVVSSSETRVGPRCPHFESCYVTRARREAEAASIVITNHHLFFADLALRGPHPGRVLPEYDAVIFDEAHQLEDTATLFFGERVSERRVSSLLADANGCFAALSSATFDSARIVLEVEREATRFFDELRGSLGDDPRSTVDEETFKGSLGARYLDLDNALLALESLADAGRAAREAEKSETLFLGLESVARRARATRDALSTIVEGARGRIAWLEAGQSGVSLSSSPVDLHDLLRERIFDRIPSVTLTSATLATRLEAPFAFVRNRLGADDCEAEVRELVVDSPFDFRANALLYLSRRLPEPGAPDFIERASAEILRLVEASDGGAFVLSTSLASMRALHRTLERAVGDREVLLQGTAPKRALLDAFRRSGRAVLVATQSFWEGVDVPGQALRLVVLEKIPFSVPTDPLVRARAIEIEQRGGQPFRELFVPAAQMMLKQGFGRLIRTRSDKGVVALMDSRVLQRGYGQALLATLPPARRVVDIEETCRFLERLRPPRD